MIDSFARARAIVMNAVKVLINDSTVTVGQQANTK